MSEPRLTFTVTCRFSKIINSILWIRKLRSEKLSNLPKITASRARFASQNPLSLVLKLYPLSCSASAEAPSLAISTPGSDMWYESILSQARTTTQGDLLCTQHKETQVLGPASCVTDKFFYSHRSYSFY